jgi:hypothetical protein
MERRPMASSPDAARTRHSETPGMLSKFKLIELIQQINRSAGADWLSRFDESALVLYLDHLQRTLEPRGGHSAWIRRGDTPAIVTKRPGR